MLDKADYPDFDEESGVLPKDDDSGQLNHPTIFQDNTKSIICYGLFDSVAFYTGLLTTGCREIETLGLFF